MIAVAIKAISFTLVAALAALILKDKNKPFGIVISVTGAFALVLGISIIASGIFDELLSLFDMGGEETLFLEILMKNIGIALLASFVSNLCKDAGENSMSRGVIIFGKVSVVYVSLPILKEAFAAIKELMLM